MCRRATAKNPLQLSLRRLRTNTFGYFLSFCLQRRCQSWDLTRENGDFEGNSLKRLSWKDALGSHHIGVPKSPGATYMLAGWEVDAELLWIMERARRRADTRMQPDLVVAIGARRRVPL